MSVWRPWDADDEEYAKRSLIREPFPDHMRAPALSWLRGALNPRNGYVMESTYHALQTALQVDFEYDGDYIDAETMVADIESRGDQFVGRVIDLLLSVHSPDPMFRMPSEVQVLKLHLDGAASALDITVQDGVYRLKRRVPQGVEELAEASKTSAIGLAGQHLGKAWSEAYSLTPNTSLVMTEAIKAVEAAAHTVVTPTAKKIRLGMITQTLKDQSGWTLAFPNRDDGHPDHKAVLVGMLETLIIAQADRHGGTAPTVLEAQGHVQLASTLVQWFSTGVVARVN
jgi:hypothetical protein